MLGFWVPLNVFGVLLLALAGNFLGWTLDQLFWRAMAVVSLVGIIWSSSGLVRTLDGYTRPVLNTGTSLPGNLFLCKRLSETPPLRRGEIIYYVPSEALKALIREHAPAAELRLGWLKQVVAVAGDDVCWGENW